MVSQSSYISHPEVLAVSSLLLDSMSSDVEWVKTPYSKYMGPRSVSYFEICEYT